MRRVKKPKRKDLPPVEEVRAAEGNLERDSTFNDSYPIEEDKNSQKVQIIVANREDSIVMWSAPDISVQPTPIISNANYRPEFSADECEALRTGVCPLENGISENDSICGRLLKSLLSGEAPDSPVSLLHDRYQNLVIFQSGRHITCVYAHIATEHADMEIPTEVRNCRIYATSPKDIIILTKGSWEEEYGTIPAFIRRIKRKKELEKNSEKSQFSFSPALCEKKIVYAHGKYAVVYDPSWTVINAEAAFDSEYAYLSYMHQHTDDWPTDAKKRPSIYFSGTGDVEEAYDELTALSSDWFPGVTDWITESGYNEGEPRRVRETKK